MEGHDSSDEVKPNVSANGKQLFVVKSSVAALMKSTKYVVYMYLNQEIGDVTHAKCSCKAGIGGGCKALKINLEHHGGKNALCYKY